MKLRGRPKGDEMKKLNQTQLYGKYCRESNNKQCKNILGYLFNGWVRTSFEIMVNCKCTSVHRRLADLREYGFSIPHAIKGKKHNWYVWKRYRGDSDKAITLRIELAEKRWG
jgi:hypothetical protein